MTDDPFASAPAYRAKGWVGTLPLPRGRKTPPPLGYTGDGGAWPTAEDITTWSRKPGQNIGLRLPPNVIALDVDDPTAFLTLIELVGPLPPTWRSQGRRSRLGHMYYRLPAGVTSTGWSNPCEGVDLLRYGHRYSLVAPSRHDKEPVNYQWLRPDGSIADDGEIPGPGDLPELPAVWVSYLAGDSEGDQQSNVDPLRPPRDDFGTVGDPIPSGRHQEWLFLHACSMRARGVPEEEAAAVIRLRAKQDCRPPWAGPDDAWDAVAHAYKKYEAGEPPVTGPALSLVGAPERHDRTENGIDVPGGPRRLAVVSASEIPMRSSRWLWGAEGAHWLPLGALTLLGGREGIGKSTWAYWIAAQVTRGELPGDLHGRPRSVIICATEDAWAQTVIPRLAAAGADLARVFRVEAIDQGVSSGLVLPVDVGALAEICRDKEAALILLDPLLGTIHGRLDSHKDAEVRQALEPISRLAHDVEATVIGLIHQNKGSGDLLTRLMGSRAFAAVARAVLVCAEEKDVPNTEDGRPPGHRSFLFGQEKNSLAALVSSAIRYEIEGRCVGHDEALGKDIWSSRIRIVGMVEERVSDLVERTERESSTKGRPPSKREAAAAWLRAHLAAQVGEAAPFRDILAAALDAGHEEHNLRRAAPDAGVQVVRLPDMSSVWRLSA